MVLAQERHGQDGALTRPQQNLAHTALVGAGDGDVGNLDGLARDRSLAGCPLALLKGRRSGHVHEFLGHVLGGAQVEQLGRLVVLVDGSGLGARELHRARDDGGQHRLEI